MPPETVEEKAVRIIRERRLKIERVDVQEGLVVARCEGETGVYMLGFDVTRKQFRCTCPEMQGKCSHLTALKMVVVR